MELLEKVGRAPSVTTSSVVSSNLTSKYPGRAFSRTLFLKSPVNVYYSQLRCYWSPQATTCYRVPTKLFLFLVFIDAR